MSGMLRVRNKHYGTIKFFYISFDDYSLEENQGLDSKTAFRRLYEQVGLGWVYAITKYEPIIKRLENLACSFAEAQLLKSKRLLWSRKQLFSHLTK
ncbi:hypothetical protein CMV_022498 [Castanea mollissima]|uniref:Uncharacterized protein n=1 Tax=Castanea mollissima TaxID=60419 RepID=A0A8J4V7Z1_9ROSI|nr:hypothetical protein CMV_022498 [Castanea mollissima]